MKSRAWLDAWAMSRKTKRGRARCGFACAWIALTLLIVMALWNATRETRDACVVAAQTRREPSGALPKIIHQQWKTHDVPSQFGAWRAEFTRLFPENEYRHILWTDFTMRELIQQNYSWFLQEYDDYAHPIQRADSSRYFILHAYGGLYADLDYKPLVNFWDSLPTTRPGLIESPYKFTESVQNSLMSSPKGHSFWNHTFRVLRERAHMKNILTSTGPVMLDEAVRRAGAEFYDVLPCENFHRVPKGEAGSHSPWVTALVRTIASYTPLVKSCGNVESSRCLFGVHYNTATWLTSSSLW
jgi:hypothetical protein